MRALAFLILPGLLAGCALLKGDPKPWELPKVADAPFRGTRMQHLILESKEKELTLLAVMETDGDTFTLVGMTPLGQRLMRITWVDGKVEMETDPSVPARVDGQGILRDVVFAHWPEESLKSVLKGGRWSATFSGAERTLLRDKFPWIVVKPNPDGRGGLIVDHLEEGYKVYVTTAEETRQ